MKSLLISLFIRLVLMSLYSISPIIVKHMTDLIHAAEAGAAGDLPKKDWVLRKLQTMGDEVVSALRIIPAQGLNALLEMLVAQYYPTPVK